MDVLIYLIPIALLLGGLGLAAFLWSLKSGQYDDLDGDGVKDPDEPEITGWKITIDCFLYIGIIRQRRRWWRWKKQTPKEYLC